MTSHFLGHPFRLAIATLKLTCTVHLAFTHLFQVSPAHGPSMLPTFAVDGDWIAADMTCRRGRRVQVGDLVLYNIPIFAHQQGVKRVIGLPGDYVSIRTPGTDGEDQMIQVSPRTRTPNAIHAYFLSPDMTQSCIHPATIILTFTGPGRPLLDHR